MDFLPDRSDVVLRHILERQAANRPEKQCLIFDESDETWTYRKALDAAYVAAGALSAKGIKRDENVLIFLPNGPDFIRAWLGITTLGAVFVPVNTAFKGLECLGLLPVFGPVFYQTLLPVVFCLIGEQWNFHVPSTGRSQGMGTCCDVKS